MPRCCWLCATQSLLLSPPFQLSRLGHFSYNFPSTTYEILSHLMAPPVRFSASYTAICHAGQIAMSCWTVSRVLLDTLTSDQGLANDMVISLQSGRPEVIDYQKTSCLENLRVFFILLIKCDAPGTAWVSTPLVPAVCMSLIGKELTHKD